MTDLLDKIISEGVLVFNENRTVKEMDKRRVYQLAKRYLLDVYPTEANAFEFASGKTVYNVLKQVPLVFIVGLALDMVDATHMLEVMTKHSNEDVITDIKFKEEYETLVQQFDDLYSKWFAAQDGTDKLVWVDVKDFELPELEGKDLVLINTVLDSKGLPSYDSIKKEFSSFSSLKDEIDSLNKENKITKEEAEKLREELTKALSRPTMTDIKVETASAEIPNGEIKMVKASSVFPGLSAGTLVPVFEWDGPHPYVPEVDEHYIFRPEHVMRILYALTNNKRMFIHGHTGTGKTTLLEQVAARLKFPFLRINFDSEITRMDLIGRDTLTEEGGKTISKFVDGMLPQMMSQPCIACFDEFDAVRPDVSYVMQSVLENNGLRITEDGGRLVQPHPLFRMFATGNTVGQGDEMGMYQAVRPQSLALLDRFTVWAKVDYLDEGQREALLSRHYPALDPKAKTAILKYVTEHISAFTDSKVLQPISPRGMLAIADVLMFIGPKGIKQALEAVVLDRASRSDYAVIKGIIDRVVK